MLKFLKRLFFLIIISIHGNSSSASVMDVIDGTEDYYVLLSNKVKIFLCGQGDQKVSISRLVKFLLCSKINQDIETPSINSSSESGQRSDVFDFITIRADRFKMGLSIWDKNWSPGRKRVKVTISRSFEIMRTEITQSEWVGIMEDNPSYFSKRQYCERDYTVVSTENGEIALCPHHPVDNVSWDMIQVFIEELNNRENLTGCDGTPDSSPGCYRLPTEAEWMLAVRQGSKSTGYFGDELDQLEYIRYRFKSNDQDHGVDGKNDRDSYVNVWEWNQDGYEAELTGGFDPLVVGGSERVVRGGSWNPVSRYFRSILRNHENPKNGHVNVGFRLARNL